MNHIHKQLLYEELIGEDIIDQAIEEYRRYMFLLFITPYGFLPFSSAVEQVCRMHILFTHDYAVFCEIMGTFVHYAPLPKAISMDMLRGISSYFSKFYLHTFHESPPVEIWDKLREENEKDSES